MPASVLLTRSAGRLRPIPDADVGRGIDIPAALLAGLAYLAYLATFVFSIPVKFGLWVDVLDDPAFVLGSGNSTAVLWGALFEVLTALGSVTTAVALYTRRPAVQRTGCAGFVATRVLEAVIIFVGVFSILAVVRSARR